MLNLIGDSNRARRGGVLAALAAVLLAACVPAPHESGINDPAETANRKVHEFNKSVDRALLKPMAGAMGPSGGGLIVKGISNFGSNLALPGMIVNDILQANVADTFANTFRFALNSTVGLGGLIDVAGQNGLGERSTDFGETLFVWGVNEGRYVELPFIGPSTQRAAVGTAVDFLIDPVNHLVPAPEKYYATAARLAARMSNRSRFASTVESILYESADSYAQARLLYLQSRRAQLYGGVMEEDLEDPYAE